MKDKIPEKEGKVRVVRRKKVTVAHSAHVEMADDHTKMVMRLVEFWDKLFEKTTKMPDDSASEHRKFSLMEDILAEVGEERTVQRLVRLLLTDPRAAWVNNKSLHWLASRKNRTYIAPLLIKKQAPGVAYKGERTDTKQIVFKR